MDNKVLFTHTIDPWQVELRRVADTAKEKQKTCKNKCMFCLADQMPEGCASEAYVKTEDHIASLLNEEYSNFANITHDGLMRIEEAGVQTVRLTVHAADLSTRRKMLGNINARDGIRLVKRFTQMGALVHIKIPLCRAINDREVLNDTLLALEEYHENIAGIAIVPAPITKHRTGLHCLQRFNQMSARAVLAKVTRWQKHFMDKSERRLVFASDEFYRLAGMPLPPVDHYEEFPMTDCNVGACAQFKLNFDQVLKDSSPVDEVLDKIVIAGKLFAPVYTSLAERLGYENVSGLRIENNFLGDDISVAEMLAGQDIIDQIRNIPDAVVEDLPLAMPNKPCNNPEMILVPSGCLYDKHEKFIDNMTLKEVSKVLGAQVLAFSSPEEFLGLLMC